MKKIIFIILLLAFVSLASAEQQQRAVVCDEVTTEGIYTICTVTGGGIDKLGGTASAGDQLIVNQISLLDSTLASSENVILKMNLVSINSPGVTIAFDGFDSVVFSTVNIIATNFESSNGSSIYRVKRFFNASKSKLVSGTVIINAYSINFISLNLTSQSAVELKAPFISILKASSVAGNSVLNIKDSHNYFYTQPQEGNVNILGNLSAIAININASISILTISRTNTTVLLAAAKSINLGSSGESGTIGHNNALLITLMSTGDVRQYSNFPLKARNVGIMAGGDVKIYGNIVARYKGATNDLQSIPNSGKLVLISNKDITIYSGADLLVNQYLSASYGEIVPSVEIQANEKIRIRGRIDNYDSESNGIIAGGNSIKLEATQITMEQNNDFKIESAHRIYARGANIIIPDELASEITANKTNTVPAGVKEIVIKTCRSDNIPATFARDYYEQDVTLCAAPVVLNVYGYLTNVGGRPYATGSAKVNFVRVGVPNGRFINGVEPNAGEDGNVSLTVNNIFSDGFFSFSLPALSLAPGEYKINATFSNKVEFNCETGACQERLIVASLPITR